MSVEKKKVAFLWFTSFQKAPVHPEQIHGSVVRSLRWSNEKFRVQVVVPWLWGDHWKRAKLRIIWWNSYTKTSIDLENQNFHETKSSSHNEVCSFFLRHQHDLKPLKRPTGCDSPVSTNRLSSHPDELRPSFVQGDASLFIEDRGCLAKNAETNPTPPRQSHPTYNENPVLQPISKISDGNLLCAVSTKKRTKDQWFRNLAALYQKKKLTANGGELTYSECRIYETSYFQITSYEFFLIQKRVRG